MQVHEIRRDTPNKKKKTVGRGGTRGKTSGKGGKGQTARAGHKVRPAMRDRIKKLPKLRGHGKNRAKSVFDRGPEAVVNLSALNIFGAGETVNPKTLVAKGLIKAIVGKLPKVKILGTGDITVKVTIEGCQVSDTAKEKIEKAGGSIIAIVPNAAAEEARAESVKRAEKKAAKKSPKKAEKKAK